MTVAFGIAIAIIGVSAVLGVIATVRANSDASRAVIGDLLFFSAIAVFILVAAIANSAVVFDVAVIASLLGILATLALGQMLTRGRR
ncbi:transporter [Nostocoides sp. F2B08]|uniref:transporter n=1 Tax=Nostocoides sp. F2B08 TaxID=2653936 RepID=UPI00126367F1|nr:transporter [Tetrasphaera sp. F2B08]KAB7746541.1 transporter [Tetrasphaera sp. F2B08]